MVQTYLCSSLRRPFVVRSDLHEWISKMETMRNLTPGIQAGLTSEVMMFASSGNTMLRRIEVRKG